MFGLGLIELIILGVLALGGAGVIGLLVMNSQTGRRRDDAISDDRDDS